jgi:ankyrin repeat protein
MPVARTLTVTSLAWCCLVTGPATELRAQDLNEDLLAATRKGDLAQVKSLLGRGADVNAKSPYGSTPLFFACDRGHMEVIKLLLDRGADLNTEDTFYHFTPLIWAVEKERPEVVKLLLDHGAKSPALVLTAAVQGGNVSMLKIALDAGKDKGGIDKATLSTALATALQAKKSEIADLLTAAGAEPLKIVQLDAAILNTYTGAYTGGRGGTEFEFTFVVKEGALSGTLLGQGAVTYAPSDKTHFHSVEIPGINIEFLSGDSFRITQGGGTIDFKRKAVTK